jgi:hypothetical protein
MNQRRHTASLVAAPQRRFVLNVAVAGHEALVSQVLLRAPLSFSRSRVPVY